MKLELILTMFVISSCATRKDVARLENKKNEESKITKEIPTEIQAPVKDLSVALQDKPPAKKFEEIKTRYQEKREFFAVAGNFLISGFEQDSKTVDNPIFKTWVNEDKLWRFEEVEKLQSIGLKKGTVVQYFNFEDNKVKRYEIKDRVHIRLVPQSIETKDQTSYRTFYVLLSDDTNEGKDEYIGENSGDKDTGIAYAGERFTLNPVKDEVQPPSQDLDLNDEETKSIVSLFDESLDYFELSDHKIGTASFKRFKNNRIYFFWFTSDIHKQDSESGGSDHEDNGTVLRTHSDKIWFIASPQRTSEYGSGGIIMQNFVKEADLGFLQYFPGMHNCFDLHLLIGDEMESHQIKCDSGGC